jgi:hypothetical protein
MKNMKSSFAKICLVLLTAVIMAAFTTNAQTNSSETSTNMPPAKPKLKSKRYAGKVDSVDSNVKTITFTSASGVTQTFHITSKTRIKNEGEPATFADVAAGLKIFGAEHKDDSGDWVATTVNIGEPKKKAAPPAASAPADSTAPAASK